MVNSPAIPKKRLIIKPHWLFWCFMPFYVFGEITLGSIGSVQVSLTNLFSILAAVLIFLFLITHEETPFTVLRSAKARAFLLALGVFLTLEFWSALLNYSYRPLLTSLSNFISVLVVLLLVRNKRRLFQGLALGTLSVGALGLLTILRGLNITSIGYQARISYGAAPWEQFIHRSIGLPGMDGGTHAVYILALLPLALLLATEGWRMGIGKPLRAVLGLISLMGIVALLIAGFRSGWLGLTVSAVVLFLSYYQHKISPATRRGLIFLIVCLSAMVLILYANRILSDIYSLLFAVRATGVQARLIQFGYVWQRITDGTWHSLLGYGYEDFGLTFIPSLAGNPLSNNPELYPWLHNYFLGVLYASGWPAFLLFVTVIIVALGWLYRQTRSKDEITKLVSVGVLSGLLSILAVLNFTAVTSGLHILWILLAVPALLDADRGRREVTPGLTDVPGSSPAMAATPGSAP